MVQNEANSSIADCGFWPPVAAGRDNIADSETPAARRLRPDAGQSCKTKPICPRTGKQGHGWSKSCETNPISWGQMCKTKPIWLVGRSPERQMRKTNPIWPGLGKTPTGERCKTNPICWIGLGPGERNAQNEPNSGRRGRRESPMIPVFHHSSVPIRCRSCKTNPICSAAPGGARPQRRGTRGECAKRSQFRRRGAGRRGGGRWVLYKQTQFLPSCRSGDRRSREGKCAKQSQLAAGEPVPEIPHHSTILLFEHSNPMPMARNEAIVVRQSGPSSCYIGVGRSLTNQAHGQDARATRGPFRCRWKTDS